MLRAIIGFNHIAPNVVDTWIPTSGYKLTRYINELTYGRGFVIKPSGGLGVHTVPVATRSLGVLDLGAYLSKTTVPGFVYFGFKIRLEQEGTFTYTDLSAWLDNGNGTTAQGFCTFDQWFNANSKVGDEILVEITMNMANGQFDHHRNGIYMGTGTMTAGNLAGIKAGNFSLLWSFASANGTGSCSVRNIWITDDLPGDGIVGRLGDVQVVPVVIDEASGANWAASDGGSILNALKAAPETANPALVSNTSSAGDLAIGLSIPALGANQRIIGVQVQVAAKGSAAGNVGVSAKQGANVTGKRSVAVTGTLQYGLPNRPWTRAPDGTPWTKTNVDATSVLITPDM